MKKGTILCGKYHLLEELGHGSGGRVFLAVDILLKKRWAIKVFTDIGLHRQEIQILKELEHPMIPRIVEYIEESGSICLVMDYLEGADLAVLHRGGRTFSRNEILHFAISVCEILEYLHSRQPPVIYRDLKPHNLLLQKNGMLKLVDFGSACFLKTEPAKDELQAGTKGYAAPEQFGGKSDARTDLYALGVTFDLLYDGTDRRLRHILRKCRAENPGRRYQSAAALKQKLIRMQETDASRTTVKKLAAAATVILVSLSLLQYVIRLGTETAYQDYLLNGEYRAAAELYPEREDVYLKMLREGVNSGRTMDALEQTAALRFIYPEETTSHQQVLLEMGMLWFLGNPLDTEFAVDYEKASEYFSQLPAGRFPEADSGMKLLGVLLKAADTVDWKQAAEALEKLKSGMHNDAGVQRIRQLDLLASVWMTNRSYLQNAGADPLKKAASLLEEATELSVEINQREAYTGIQTALAQAYYLDGMLHGDEALLKKWEHIYRSLQEELLPEKLRCQNWQRAAYVYEELRSYDEAAGFYERLIEHDPDDTGNYCEYALMELLKQKNTKKAVQLYQRAGRLPDAEKHRDYQILKERLEGIE